MKSLIASFFLLLLFLLSLLSFPLSTRCHLPNNYISRPLEATRGEEKLSSSYSQLEEKLSHTIDSLLYPLTRSFSSFNLSSCRSIQSCSNLHTPTCSCPLNDYICMPWARERVWDKGRGLNLLSTMYTCKFSLVNRR